MARGESPAQAKRAAQAYRMGQQSRADTQKLRTGGRPRNYVAGHGPDPLGGGAPRKTSAPGVSPKNIKATQAFLRSKGYNIAVDGVWGPASKKAIADWHKAPKDRTPGLLGNIVRTVTTAAQSAISRRPSAPAPKAKPSAAKAPPAKAHPAAKGGGHGGGGNLAASLAALNNPAPASLGGLGNGIVGAMLQPGYADAVAGEQYDPTLHDLALQRARQPKQRAQDLSDIKHFYAQVMGHQKEAGVRDAALEQAGQGSMQNAVQAILGSIGGAANAGSSTVGAAGADAVGTLKALGQNNDQYNNDMAPLLAAEGAAAGTREISAQDAQAQDIATKIQDALGARGQAKTKALGDVIQANNALAQQRFQNVNTLAQQRFQNRVAILNTVGAAQMAGLKTADLLSTIKYRNKRTAAVGKVPPGKNAPKTWLQMPGDQRMAAIDANLKPYVGAYGELLPHTDPNMVANQLRAALRSQGFSSARRAGFKGPGVNPRAQQAILEGIHTALQQAIGRRGYAAAQTAAAAK